MNAILIDEEQGNFGLILLAVFYDVPGCVVSSKNSWQYTEYRYNSTVIVFQVSIRTR